MSAERGEKGRTRILTHALTLQGSWVPRALSYSALSAQLTALLLLAACAIPQVPSRTVYEDPVNYVRLEEDGDVLAEWPPTYFAHPAPMGSDKLRAILSGLMIQEERFALQRWLQGEAPLMPAFRDDEIALLAVQIAKALAEAKYNERVTFYLSQPQTSAKRVITSGGLYIKGSELHLILGNWQIIYGIPTYGMIYDRRYPMRPTAAKGFNIKFQLPEAVIVSRSSWFDDLLANAKDELVLDLTKIQVPEPAPIRLSPPIS